MTLALYTDDYTSTEKYHRLTSFYPHRKPLHIRWLCLSDCNHPFHPSITSATALRSRALRFVQALLSSSLTGWNHCTSNISLAKFEYLLSMHARVPLHMEFVVASGLHHQASDTRRHTIFVGPFVTHIIQSMCLLGCVHRLYSSGRSFSLQTLQPTENGHCYPTAAHGF